ncbi:hypothetical protein MOQ_005556 [Trypanosoma cruzi marinkellei]|uniref:Uncharacterized protein n=1 Tax=Trypanosoma cruzi marinkellei TaxID=85056 RepID=K2NP63_TRYCR|nr:hypothetical protein MOQ_005556 [Trypanosoma cruzi marinkellei]
MKYLVLLGQLPGEGVWATAEDYNGLVSQMKEAFGDDYNPIFKYKLPCNPKMLSPPNGTCHIIIDDEDDFQIWKNGRVPVNHHRDALDDIHYPSTPLTTTLYVFRKDVYPDSTYKSKDSGRASRHLELKSGAERPSPEVLHAEHDVVKMPLYSLLPPLLLLQLGVRVALRHSNAAEAILFSSRSVSGAGEGHWGLMVRKAQSAWGVLRPSFRYLDLDHGVTAMNIFNVRDYMFWSRGVGRERVELVVLEHVYRDVSQASPLSGLLTAGIEKPRTAEATCASYNTVAARRVDGTLGSRCNYTVTTEATVRGVHCGLYGPSFTTDALIPPKYSELEAEVANSLEHHRSLVGILTRSGMF